MPYNSSAFEKQLAKYKAAQASKPVEEMPLPEEEGHVVRARAPELSVKIKPSKIHATQMVGDGAQTASVLRAEKGEGEPKTIIIYRDRKIPFYRRAGFLFWMLTIISTLAMPIMYPKQTRDMLGLLQNLKGETGFDVTDVRTYGNLMPSPHINTPATPLPAAAPFQTEAQINQYMGKPTDLHNAVDEAQKRANEVVRQGPEHSLQYIQSETERLNKMAKELDKQAGH